MEYSFCLVFLLFLVGLSCEMWAACGMCGQSCWIICAGISLQIALVSDRPSIWFTINFQSNTKVGSKFSLLKSWFRTITGEKKSSKQQKAQKKIKNKITVRPRLKTSFLSEWLDWRTIPFALQNGFPSPALESKKRGGKMAHSPIGANLSCQLMGRGTDRTQPITPKK